MSVLRRKNNDEDDQQTACADRRICAEGTGSIGQLNKTVRKDRSVGLKQGLYKSEQSAVLWRLVMPAN